MDQRACALPKAGNERILSTGSYGKLRFTRIFDIETPRTEIGYEPVHDAEVFYG